MVAEEDEEEAIGSVALWQVVEERRSGLEEDEAWAVLAAAATTLQDRILSGGDLPEVVTAESLMLLPGGHVDLRAPQATGPPRARAPRHEMPYYLPPEVLAQQTHLLHDDVEKGVIYSLGRSLQVCLEFGVSSSSRNEDNLFFGAGEEREDEESGCRRASWQLRATLKAMTHHDPQRRLSLADIFELLVERGGRTRYSFTNIISTLYKQVGGARLRTASYFSLTLTPSRPLHPAPASFHSIPARTSSTVIRRPQTSVAAPGILRRRSLDCPGVRWPAGSWRQTDGEFGAGGGPQRAVRRSWSRPLSAAGASLPLGVGTEDASRKMTPSEEDLQEDMWEGGPGRTRSASVPPQDALLQQSPFHTSMRRHLIRSKMKFYSMETFDSSKENVDNDSLPPTPKETVKSPLNHNNSLSLDYNIENEIGAVAEENLQETGGPPGPQVLEDEVQPEVPSLRKPVTLARSATIASAEREDDPHVALGRRPGGHRIPPKKPPRARAMSVDSLFYAKGETETGTKKTRPVVRAPSALYRFNAQGQSLGQTAPQHINTDSTKGTVPAPTVPSIVGPEFVLRSKHPPKTLTVAPSVDWQKLVLKKVTVVTLAGRRLEITCEAANTRVVNILQALVDAGEACHVLGLPAQAQERISTCRDKQVPVLGLAVLGGGEFHFVAPTTKLHKIAPPGWKDSQPSKDGLIQDNFTLHLRIIYYCKFADIDGLEAHIRSQLYLQLRHDLLEGHVHLGKEELLELAALALQTEFGDQKTQAGDYFLAEHYMAASHLRGGAASQVVAELSQRHAALHSMSCHAAATAFILRMQNSPHYGTHYYHVTQDKGKTQYWLGISPTGVAVLEGPPSVETISSATMHEWSLIKRVSYSSHRLSLTVKGQKKTVKTKFDTQENRSRHMFYLIMVHQKFKKELQATSLMNLPPLILSSGHPICERAGALHLPPSPTSSTSEECNMGPTSLASSETWDRGTASEADQDIPKTVAQESEAATKTEEPDNVQYSQIPKMSKVTCSQSRSQEVVVDQVAQEASCVRQLPDETLQGLRGSTALSKASFYHHLRWSGAHEESAEIILAENQENEHHQEYIQKQKQQFQENQLEIQNTLQQWKIRNHRADELFSCNGTEMEPTGALVTVGDATNINENKNDNMASTKSSPLPRILHQRSKSNVESVSAGLSLAPQPQLKREFGSDESLLVSPKKAWAAARVRMGTRVSTSAMHKHRLRTVADGTAYRGLAALESLQRPSGAAAAAAFDGLPSVEELATSPQAVVVEPSGGSGGVGLDETLSESLVERFLLCPNNSSSGPERRLATVHLTKDSNGSLGIMIAEGLDKGLYIQAVSPGGVAAAEGSLKFGDRIVGINGRSVENVTYGRAVEMLRLIPRHVTLLVSQPCLAQHPESPAAAPRASSVTSPTSTVTPLTSTSTNSVTGVVTSEGCAPRAESGVGSSSPSRTIQQRSSPSSQGRCRRGSPPKTTEVVHGPGHSGHQTRTPPLHTRTTMGVARVDVLGGAKEFTTEVTSGPVTVVTVNVEAGRTGDSQE